MDIETALDTLYELPRGRRNLLHIDLKLCIRSLRCVSGSNDDNLLANVLSIFENDTITIMAPPRNGEIHPIKSLPYRRLLLYKYLQQHNFEEANEHTVKLLHIQLVDLLDIENDICEILKVLNSLYNQHCFFNDRYNILSVLQRVTFIRDKRCNKQMLMVFDSLLNNHFPPYERSSLLNQLFDLANFGVMEFLICSSLFKVARRIWRFSYIHKFMKFVMQGFGDNNVAFAASILLATMIEHSYDEHIDLVTAIIKFNYTEPARESSRTLVTSFTKYIIPICAKKYGAYFFNYTADMHLSYRLLVSKYLFITKNFVRSRHILTGVILGAARSDDREMAAMGFQLLCHFHNMKTLVTLNDFKLFKKMLIALPEMTPAIRRSIHQFISQITLAFVYFGERSLDYTTHYEFYQWLHELLETNMDNNTFFANIAAEVFCFAIEVLIKSSSYLVTSYFIRPNLYLRNPLYAILFENFSGLFDCMVYRFFKKYVDSVTEVPLAEKCLKRLLYQHLNEAMIYDLYQQFFDITPAYQAWSIAKVVSLSCILVNCLVHRRRFSTIYNIHSILMNIIKDRIMRFVSPQTHGDVEGFLIFTHVEVLTMLMQTPTVRADYETECQVAVANIKRIIVPFCIYTQKNLPGFKHIKKNTERSLVALVNHAYTSVKIAGYPKHLVHVILKMTGGIITHIPLKKLIVVTCQRLTELLKTTPRYNDTYVEFYYEQKSEFFYKPNIMTLRKSAGIRNLLHTILKTIKKRRFLESEITDLLCYESSETADISNLKINLLECLISDGDLKQKTIPFVLPVFDHAFDFLTHSSSIVKNSTIQLISVIATRLLGPVSEKGVRELSAFDMFIASPEFAAVISNRLYDPSTDRTVKICILGFLSESNRNSHLYNLRCGFDLEQLRSFFGDEFLCDSAISAYIACIPQNRLYTTMMRLFTEIDFDCENLLKLNNDVEVVLKLADRFMETYPEHRNIEAVVLELHELLDTWNNDYFIEKHVHKITSRLMHLQFTPRSLLEDNEGEVFPVPTQVNCNYLLCLVKYVDLFVNKIDVDENFLESLLRFLYGTEGLPVEFVICAKNVAMNFISCHDIDFDARPVKEVPIDIQELFVVVTCKRTNLVEADFKNINEILEHSIELIIANPNLTRKRNIVLNIIENITKFVFINKITASHYLLGLFILTYTLEDNEKLSNIYYFLTGHVTRNPKSGLFLILNNLELYLSDKASRKELLQNLLQFVSQHRDFNSSYIYSNPTHTVEKIYFELKLNENVLCLLHSINRLP